MGVKFFATLCWHFVFAQFIMKTRFYYLDTLQTQFIHQKWCSHRYKMFFLCPLSCMDCGCLLELPYCVTSTRHSQSMLGKFLLYFEQLACFVIIGWIWWTFVCNNDTAKLLPLFQVIWRVVQLFNMNTNATTDDIQKLLCRAITEMPTPDLQFQFHITEL